MIQVRVDVLSAIKNAEIQSIGISDELLRLIEDEIVPHLTRNDLSDPPNEASRNSLHDLRTRTNLQSAKSFAEILAAARSHPAEID